MTVTLSESIAAEIRAEMARQTLTQRELARRIGWDQRYLSRRLKDRVSFSVDDLEHISAALGVAYSALTRMPVS